MTLLPEVFVGRKGLFLTTQLSEEQITLFDGVGFAVEDFSALRYVRDQLEAKPRIAILPPGGCR